MIERRCKGGNLESVNKPKIICDYNANMAGVDKADQLMVYYACGRKSLKWYKGYFGAYLTTPFSMPSFFINHLLIQVKSDIPKRNSGWNLRMLSQLLF